jgi:ribose/xylose/arabinose/galactoside ABC-type transport system permease subunit
VQGSPATRLPRLRLDDLQRFGGLLTALRLGGLAGAILAAGLAFTLINGNFLTTLNMLGLLRSMSVLGIIAIGELFVLVTGELDLSVGATYGLAAMAFGVVWVHGTTLWLALLVGLGVGVAVGVVNAFFTTLVGIPSFVVSLGILNFAQGVTLLISGSRAVYPDYATPPVDHGELRVFNAIGSSTLPGQVPIQIVWLVGTALVFGLLLQPSRFGFRLKAIGDNLEAARRVGLKTRRYKLAAFCICGALAALGGVLDFSFIGSTEPSAGLTLTFPVFAAVIIGGASLSGGRGTVAGTLCGALLLALLVNGLTLVGVGTYAQLLFVGLITVGAVTLDRLSGQLPSSQEARA